MSRVGYSAAETAEALGLDVKTVRDAANRGEIPHRKIGRRLVFPSPEVLARWLRAECPHDNQE